MVRGCLTEQVTEDHAFEDKLFDYPVTIWSLDQQV